MTEQTAWSKSPKRKLPKEPEGRRALAEDSPHSQPSRRGPAIELSIQGVLGVQIPKQAQAFALDRGIALGSLQSGLKQLLVQGVQTKLLLEEPAQLTIRDHNALRFQVSHGGAKPAAILSHSLSRSPGQVQVELGSKLATLIQGALPIHGLQGLHELVQAREGVLVLIYQDFSGVRILQELCLLVLQLLWIKLLAPLSHSPDCRSSHRAARL